MKTLVVWYSRTGNTKRLGQEIAKRLGAETDEVVDLKKRSGVFGWLGGGRDAMRKKEAQIEHQKDPGEFDLVVVGTPVWVGTMTPAIRAYLAELRSQSKKVAFFATVGGDISKTFDEMEKVCQKPLATLSFKDKDFKDEAQKEEIAGQIEDFCAKLS